MPLMKLDNLLEQMMMQKQQQTEEGGGEPYQNVQQQQQMEPEEGRQTQRQRVDIPQNNAGTTTNEEFQTNNGVCLTDHCHALKLRKCTNNNNDSLEAPAAVGGTENGRESLPQQLEFFSAFLRANWPLLSAFSAPALPPPPNSLHFPTLSAPTTQQIVPLSKEIASQGLLAVGGCRPCHKTFTSRLELIHHCVDHFPNVFYSFEERTAQNNGQPQHHQQQQQQHSPLQLLTKNGTQNLVPNGGVNLQQLDPTFAETTQKMDILGQLAGFLAFNENGSSGSSSDHFQPIQNVQNSLLANFFKSFGPMPFQPLTATESAKHLATNGSTENIREQQRKRTIASSASNPRQSQSRPSTSAARKRQINHEKAVNSGGKRQTEDGQSTPLVGSNKNSRKSNDSGGERQRNGNSGGDTAMATTANGASTTAPAMPTLSELPYHMCPHCCLTFAETSAFRTHLNVHESEVTASSTSSPTGAPFLASSLLASTNDDTVSRGAETVAQPQQQTAPKCSLCDKKFVDAFRLSEHMQLHRAHACSECQKAFMTAFDLNLHMGTHSGFTYDCKDCGKCFPCRKTLAEHNKSHRMILSAGGGNVSPELPKKVKNESVQGHQDREHSPVDLLNSSDNGSEKRRMRVAKRGEKSRRNATLVAVESAIPSPPIPLPQPTPIYSTASSSSSSAGVTRCSNESEGGEADAD